MANAQALRNPAVDVPYIRHIPVKRLFDLLFSSATLVFGAPFFILIALIIRATSTGAPLYSQWRIGRGGRPFRCYKFRTMYRDADQRLESLLNQNAALRQEWEETRKLKQDPRVTPLGALLRKTSLDELPQFFNVLRGDISVVGPRPVVLEEVQAYMGCRAPKILSIRPGITGLWQVSGRNDLSYQQRLDLEERYVDTRSLWLDFKIILKTIPAMLQSRGAY